MIFFNKIKDIYVKRKTEKISDMIIKCFELKEIDALSKLIIDNGKQKFVYVL